MQSLDLKFRLYPSILFILTIIFCFGATGCSDDGDSTVEDSDLCLVEVNGVFQEIELDEMPEYLDGGSSGFVDAIYEILKYPAEARADGIEGDCILNYEITTTGTVENIIIIQDPGGGIGDAVFEVLETITEGVSFSPGILDGNAVLVKKESLIKFRLEG